MFFVNVAVFLFFFFVFFRGDSLRHCLRVNVHDTPKNLSNLIFIASQIASTMKVFFSTRKKLVIKKIIKSRIKKEHTKGKKKRKRKEKKGDGE
jgi:hypothetical protein